MNSLKWRFAGTFIPLSVTSVVLIGFAMLVILEKSSRRQADVVSSLMMNEIKTNVTNNLRIMNRNIDLLFSEIDRASGELANRPDFISYLDKSQPEPLIQMLRSFSAANGLDFAVVFEIDGNILSAYPTGIDDIQAHQIFRESDLYDLLQKTIANFDSEKTNGNMGYMTYGAAFLRTYTLADTGHPGGKSYGPFFLKVISDEFGDVLGYIFSGFVFDHSPDVLKIASIIPNSVFVGFVDGEPVISTGFDAGPFRLTETDKTVISEAADAQFIKKVGGTNYLLQCQPIKSISGADVATH